jgi:hypothetical protein
MHKFIIYIIRTRLSYSTIRPECAQRVPTGRLGCWRWPYPGIPPTFCKKRGKKKVSILGTERIFNKKEKKKRHIVFVGRKLKLTGTIVLLIRKNLNVINTG